MHIKAYQDEAKRTIQKSKASPNLDEFMHYFGIVGEVGSVISELKKRVRDDKGYIYFKEKLQEELGDVLWYISAIASLNDLDLEQIAKVNLSKIKERFGSLQQQNFRIYDEVFPVKEQFPREFEIVFKSVDRDNKTTIIVTDEKEKQLGDTLNDNTYTNDGYRYHDVFHFGYVAYLGWSPVIRSLMDIKRRTNKEIDENEDGGRAKIIEELITLYIHSEAKKCSLFKYTDRVDNNILNTVKQLVQDIEVKNCSSQQWESAIIGSYKVYHDLLENNGGRILVSIKNQKLLYIGKN